MVEKPSLSFFKNPYLVRCECIDEIWLMSGKNLRESSFCLLRGF